MTSRQVVGLSYWTKAQTQREEQRRLTVGTIFERSKVPLSKWWFAIHLLASSKKGMSAHQLHRMIGVTYQTAWFMEHRIREAIAALRPILDHLSSRPRLVFTTHAHIDHVGSHPEFADCDILVHPTEADELARPGQRGLLFPERSAEEIAAFLRSGIDPSRFMVEAVPFVGYDPESYQRARVKPTRLASEGDVVETGDREFQVLHLPGHSPGSMALWERSSGSLFSGDAIYDGIIIDNLLGSDVEMYRATMKRIAELPVAQVFGGRNAPMTRTQMLDVVERYLASRP